MAETYQFRCTGGDCKVGKEGSSPSQIGVILRDYHGVAQVRRVAGNKIFRTLKAKGMTPEIHEHVYHLIKKAVSIRKNLERSRKDIDSSTGLFLWSHESIALLVVIKPLVSSQLRGNTNLLLLLLLFHKIVTKFVIKSWDLQEHQLIILELSKYGLNKEVVPYALANKRGTARATCGIKISR